MHRKLEFPAALNARDLGGYSVAPGKQTRWGSFVRCDSLRSLTPDGVRAVLDHGVRTIVDLRYPYEVERDPNPFASRQAATQYIHLSLMGDSWDAWMARRPAFGRLSWYPAVLDVCQPELCAALQIMAGAPTGGVLYHCHAGKDRTGILSILLLALAGVDEATIAEDYALSSETLRPDLEAQLSQTSDPAFRARLVAGYSCPPEYALELLAHLNGRYRGAASYMRQIGLSGSQIDRLIDRLV